MNISSPTRRRLLLARVVAGIFLFLITLAPLHAAKNALHYLAPATPAVLPAMSSDYYNRVFPRVPTGATVVVAIDDESIKRLGQFPWPRNVMGL